MEDPLGVYSTPDVHAEVDGVDRRMAGPPAPPVTRIAVPLRTTMVGLEDAHKVMASLASSMEEEFGRAGFRQEGRDLHPHLTLARFRVPQPIEKEIASSEPFEFDRSPFDVTETVLFRSRLSPKGATYEAIERFSLE